MTIVKKVIFLAAFIVVGLCLKNIAQSIALSKNYTVDIDSRLASLKKQIPEYIQQKLKNKNALEINKAIQERFSVIDQVIIKKVSPYYSFIKLRAYDPLYLINFEKVYASNGQIFDKSLFKKNIINDIAKLSVSNIDDAYSSEFKQFISGLNEPLLDLYSISWVDKKNIRLKSISDAYEIVTRYDKLPDMKTIEALKNIKNENLVQKKGNKNRNIVFDLRFKDRAVLSFN